MKALICVPELSKPGGVANYYRALESKLTPNHSYFTRGARGPNEGLLPEMVRLLNDYFRFFVELLSRRYSLVHINTSFGRYGVLRDAVFILISKIFGLKVLVFFRGWDRAYESKVADAKFSLFKRIFFIADGFVVLASEFKDRLSSWGFKNKLFVETTVVDEKLLDAQTVEQIQQKSKEDNSKISILFLARIEKDKGILEAIKAFSLLKKRYAILQMFVVGDGSFLTDVRDYVNSEGIEDVFIKGHLNGSEKRDIFLDSDIYLFPSRHEEGMPNSLLEAMAFGLPVVTTPMGGIKDFFENGKMGFLTASSEPLVLAQHIEGLIKDKEMRRRISSYNFQHAWQRFMTSQVSERLNSIYEDICKQ